MPAPKKPCQMAGCGRAVRFRGNKVGFRGNHVVLTWIWPWTGVL
jgi:hypothetical protein